MGLGVYPETQPLALGMLGMHGTVFANYAARRPCRARSCSLSLLSRHAASAAGSCIWAFCSAPGLNAQAPGGQSGPGGPGGPQGSRPGGPGGPGRRADRADTGKADRADRADQADTGTAAWADRDRTDP